MTVTTYHYTAEKPPTVGERVVVVRLYDDSGAAHYLGCEAEVLSVDPAEWPPVLCAFRTGGEDRLHMEELAPADAPLDLAEIGAAVKLAREALDAPCDASHHGAVEGARRLRSLGDGALSTIERLLTHAAKEREALDADLREVLTALPRCHTCLATALMSHRTHVACDAHASPEHTDLPHAVAVRRLHARLAR